MLEEFGRFKEVGEMNRVKANSGWEHLLEIAKIEGLRRAYTWNPARGCNGIGCEVYQHGKCWAAMMAKRFGWDFKPQFFPEKLGEPWKVKEPSVITPVSMGDLFGLMPKHVKLIEDVIWNCIRHVFAILTKLPQNASKYWPDNVWFGVTVNSQKDTWRLKILDKISAKRKYCLFEPLYGPINFDLSFLDLIVIGPQNYPILQPKSEWVESIINNAGTVRIFLKSNLTFSKQ